MPTDTYVPVIDVSEHQGIIRFDVMRAAGIEGLIIRTNHAQVVDKRCARYVMDARAAGWHDRQLGAYTFCNPKRATGAASGKAFVDTVHQVFGRTDILLMLDIEYYATESGAGPVLKGAAFAAWIRDHIDTVHQLAPDATVIAYSNASFWNVWVGDQALAESLEWIVPRYPIYSPGGYAGNPLPAPDGWPGWAWRVGPKGPIPPSGVPWAGWQFSAGYNGQGPRYGCQSSDLDLNIVRESAWQRWTHTTPEPPPPPPIGEPMRPYLFRLADKVVGLRHESGSRGVSSGEVEPGGPFAGEPIYDIPEGSYWETYLRWELAKYERELEPPPTPAPPGGGGTGPVPYSGTITLTPGAP